MRTGSETTPLLKKVYPSDCKMRGEKHDSLMRSPALNEPQEKNKGSATAQTNEGAGYWTIVLNVMKGNIGSSVLSLPWVTLFVCT